MNRVLLIDDNILTRETYQRHFAALGFSVMSVPSAEGARALEAGPDFVLMREIAECDIKPKNANTWVYVLRENAPPELYIAAVGTPNENSVFWHRRLQRALISSSPHIRSIPLNA